jgi:hypothetical protein
VLLLNAQHPADQGGIAGVVRRGGCRCLARHRDCTASVFWSVIAGSSSVGSSGHHPTRFIVRPDRANARRGAPPIAPAAVPHECQS